MKETEQAVAASDDDTNIEELRARLAQAKLEIATLMSDNAELKEKLKEKHDPSIAAKAPLGFVVKVSSCAKDSDARSQFYDQILEKEDVRGGFVASK